LARDPLDPRQYIVSNLGGSAAFRRVDFAILKKSSAKPAVGFLCALAPQNIEMPNDLVVGRLAPREPCATDYQP
jgi:hypothetical protein